MRQKLMGNDKMFRVIFYLCLNQIKGKVNLLNFIEMTQRVLDKSILKEQRSDLTAVNKSHNSGRNSATVKHDSRFLNETDKAKLEVVFLTKKKQLYGQSYMNMQRAQNLVD